MSGPQPKSERLRILATSDLHMHLVSFDYYQGQLSEQSSLSALVEAISEERRAAAAETPVRHCLFMDNGDLLQGTPLGDYIAGAHRHGSAHPVAQAMNALGYDAVGLGNHDLDYGLSYLADFARDLDAPVLCANLTAQPPLPWLAPLAMLPAGDLVVGVVSVVPPATQKWSPPDVAAQIEIAPMADTIRRISASARARGADIVIGLAHTGFGPDPSENDLAQIAATGGLDAIIAGHTHLQLPGPDHAGLDHVDEARGTVHGVPTVMPGFGAEQLGVIDLDLSLTEDGTWQVSRFETRLLRARPRTTPLAPALISLGPAHDAAVTNLDQVIGQSAQPLNSYFAHVAPSPMLDLLARSQRHAIEALRRGTAYQGLPLLSAVAAGRAGGLAGPLNYVDIPAGPLRRRHICQMSPFSNSLVAVQITGAGLREWLEKSASCFAHIASDVADQALLDARFPTFDFDLLYGVSYEIDVTTPARYSAHGQMLDPEARRVRNISFAGQGLRDDDALLVAVNSYRAGGGGKFAALDAASQVLVHPSNSLEILAEYVANSDEADVPLDPPWRFSDAAKGRRCWIETGPGATEHIGEIAHLSPVQPLAQPSGFLRIPITL